MLGDLLAGLEARQPQAVANMTVIPLVSEAREVAVGTLRDIYLEQDPAYNRLVLGTESAPSTKRSSWGTPGRSRSCSRGSRSSSGGSSSSPGARSRAFWARRRPAGS